MEKKSLHPSIIKFKEFIKANPKIMQEVRNGKYTLQELYEDWYLLGEDDPKWEALITGKEEPEETSIDDEKADWVSKIMRNISKVDPDQLNTYIYQANQAISSILGVISQFQGSSQTNHQKQPSQPKHPFSFRKD
ncbi:YlbD family protein [Bacillus massilinigeriensis]|uniref:YlbD family protein n=1 Tax=Bacillus massilionigeriensis TaxID=1805475 RepID=UPI00096B18C5|nr:YlbD family protein [Bacillus massilionigeriensis]